MHHLTRIQQVVRSLAERIAAEEDGFSTAELLGNAALGIIALVAIWGLLQALGVDLVQMIGDAITGGFSGAAG